MKKVLPFILLGLLVFTLGCSSVQAPGMISNTRITLPSSTNTPPTIPESSPLPSKTPDCRLMAGVVTADQMESATLGKTLSYLVYLPPCYSAAQSPGYPVMYLLHGQTFNQDQWQRLGAIDAANKLISGNSSVTPFLMVMPYEQDNLAEPYDTSYGDALANDLVPYIDAHFNTCPLRTFRAIAGLSRGAAWAVWTGLHYPQLFATIGGHSFPPFVGDLYRLPTWLREIPKDEMPYIILDSGTNDPWLPDTRRFEAVLTDFSIPHSFTVNPGDHSETYWQIHINEYVRQLSDSFKPQK